jgi:hypothetical protein
MTNHLNLNDDSRELRRPAVNINGTSAHELIKLQLGVKKAADALIKALRETAPNARDWQTAVGRNYTDARDEHFSIIEVVEAIRDDADALALAIHKQIR